jgi:hypothetical protein
MMADQKERGLPMAANKVQRIKLRIQGNPIKLDATILEMSADGYRTKVRFDGPLEDAVLYRWSATLLITKDLRDEATGEWLGTPAQHKDCQFFEVL